ncbi:MAG: dimethylsulfonioproprionate lyase DddP [Pseudomonadota bacterium]
MNFHSPFSVSNRKIDPSRRAITSAHVLPDGSPNDSDRVETGPTDLAFREWAEAGLAPPDLETMRAYRHRRLVDAINARGYDGLLLFDPLNIRYATDSSNMQIWITHNPCRACFVGADGYTVLWDFHGGAHLSAHLPLVREVREGASLFYFEAGSRGPEFAARFAGEILDLAREHGVCAKPHVAVDKMEFDGFQALQALGITIANGQELTENARAIKNADELAAMRCALHSCEQAMHEMQAVMQPGLTEVELWAELQRGNHVRGGEWIETRILSSGPRTNPWFQECGPRTIRDGDIVAFDTDLIGPYGYCADLSRTWKAGDGPPTAYERDLYQVAYEHIMTNRELLKAGVGFLEISEKSHRLPPQYQALKYGVVMHGVGLCDEYPSIRYPDHIEDSGYDGVLEAGHCVCVEAYIGEVGGPCGIKLEDQVVVTETGYENLTSFPFEVDFLR